VAFWWWLAAGVPVSWPVRVRLTAESVWLRHGAGSTLGCSWTSSFSTAARPAFRSPILSLPYRAAYHPVPSAFIALAPEEAAPISQRLPAVPVARLLEAVANASPRRRPRLSGQDAQGPSRLSLRCCFKPHPFPAHPAGTFSPTGRRDPPSLACTRQAGCRHIPQTLASQTSTHRAVARSSPSPSNGVRHADGRRCEQARP
jgi:hypothetical protein